MKSSSDDIRQSQFVILSGGAAKRRRSRRILKQYYVYIAASHSRVLYVGVTNDIARRMAEHRAHSLPGFTDRYNVTKLVYVEETVDVGAALAREKQLKGWKRERKIALIESQNPGWEDLAAQDPSTPPRSFDSTSSKAARSAQDGRFRGQLRSG